MTDHKPEPVTEMRYLRVMIHPNGLPFLEASSDGVSWVEVTGRYELVSAVAPLVWALASVANDSGDMP